ncbi:hypothetical protein FOZ62_026070, partial [Perkinsus olseni]
SLGGGAYYSACSLEEEFDQYRPLPTNDMMKQPNSRSVNGKLGEAFSGRSHGLSSLDSLFITPTPAGRRSRYNSTTGTSDVSSSARWRQKRIVPWHVGGKRVRLSRRMKIALSCLSVCLLVFLIIYKLFDVLPWRLISIPLVSVVFTWFHIWLALQMCFFPIDYWGWDITGHHQGLGWQGIVPRKADKMAGTACDLMVDRLIYVREIVERIDATDLYRYLSSTGILRSVQQEVNRRIGNRWFAGVWSSLPGAVKEELLEKSLELSEDSLQSMVAEAKKCLMDKDFFDVRDLIIRCFVDDRRMLSEFFIKIGKKELHFLEFMGAVMGLICGLAQLALYMFLPAHYRGQRDSAYSWLLFPLTGLVIGLFTNWVALQLIFRPVEPHVVRIPCTEQRVKVQGLFLRRQPEVSRVYSSLVSDSILNCSRFVAYLQTTKGWDRILEVFKETINSTVDGMISTPAAIAIKMAGKEGSYERFKNDVAHELKVELSHPHYVEMYERYMDSRLGIRELMAQRLAAMPSKDFERMLHPVFQEDEGTLIILGGILGVAVGCLQVWLFGL